jgi:hypothetical protein
MNNYELSNNVQILLDFMFYFEKWSWFQIMLNMLIMLNFRFLYHKSQLCSYVIQIVTLYLWQMILEIWTMFWSYIVNF